MAPMEDLIRPHRLTNPTLAWALTVYSFPDLAVGPSLGNMWYSTMVKGSLNPQELQWTC